MADKFDHDKLVFMLTLADKQQQEATRLLGLVATEIANLKTAAGSVGAAAAATQKAATSVKSAAAEVVPAAAKGAGDAVDPAMVKAFKGVGEAATAAMNKAFEPVQGRMNQLTEASDLVKEKIEKAAWWLGWKAFALAGAGVLVTCFLGYLGQLSVGSHYDLLRKQSDELEAEIKTMQATVADLEAHGGKIVHTQDQCDGRLCIEVSPDQGSKGKAWVAPWYGPSKEPLVIPKGY